MNKSSKSTGVRGVGRPEYNSRMKPGVFQNPKKNQVIQKLSYVPSSIGQKAPSRKTLTHENKIKQNDYVKDLKRLQEETNAPRHVM